MLCDKFEIGDYVRIQFVPTIEHECLMSSVTKVKLVRMMSDTEYEYLTTLHNNWVLHANLRAAYKHEILTHKIINE